MYGSIQLITLGQQSRVAPYCGELSPGGLQPVCIHLTVMGQRMNFLDLLMKMPLGRISTRMEKCKYSRHIVATAPRDSTWNGKLLQQAA